MGFNMFFIEVAGGSSEVIPNGFLMASITPSEGASFTIENNLNGTSPSISEIFTIPSAYSVGTSSWEPHTVTASGGSVLIAYANGH